MLCLNYTWRVRWLFIDRHSLINTYLQLRNYWLIALTFFTAWLVNRWFWDASVSPSLFANLFGWRYKLALHFGATPSHFLLHSRTRRPLYMMMLCTYKGESYLRTLFWNSEDHAGLRWWRVQLKPVCRDWAHYTILKWQFFFKG